MKALMNQNPSQIKPNQAKIKPKSNQIQIQIKPKSNPKSKSNPDPAKIHIKIKAKAESNKNRKSLNPRNQLRGRTSVARLRLWAATEPSHWGSWALTPERGPLSSELVGRKAERSRASGTTKELVIIDFEFGRFSMISYSLSIDFILPLHHHPLGSPRMSYSFIMDFLGFLLGLYQDFDSILIRFDFDLISALILLIL